MLTAHDFIKAVENSSKTCADTEAGEFLINIVMKQLVQMIYQVKADGTVSVLQ